MASWLIRWSLTHRAVILVGAVTIVLLGLYALGQLNFDAFPDTTPVQVQVNTLAPALVPEEIERLITYPIELALSGLPRLEQLRSTSQFGGSAVVATFRDGTDIFFARQMISERLLSVEMPPDIERPKMGPVATGLGEVFHYLLTSSEMDLRDLRTMHNRLVKPKMRSVSGVAEINTWGGLERQFQIRIDPTGLIRHAITFDEVVSAARGNNLNVGGGNIQEKETGEMLLVQGVGRTTTVDEISNIVITAQDGQPIRIRDVANVTVGHEIRRGAITAGGRGEVVMGVGFMLMGENSYAVTKRLKDRLEVVKRDLPKEVSVETLYDRTQLVDQVISTVRSNLCDGALLVVIVTFVFLGNLRAGLIVATAIPLSMLCAFTGMWQFGIAGTLLSLGAIDFGIVVDSSVVMIENVVHHISHSGPGHDQRSRVELVRDAAIEVRQPAIFGQVIIMIVYLPILTLQGIEGKMFRPMAITVILLLCGSLIAALTLMPVMASLFLPKRMSAQDPLAVRVARRLYAPVVFLALRWRRAVLAAAVTVLIAAAVMFGTLGSEFVPRLSEGSVVIGILRPPGTDITECTRLNTIMERLLLETFPNEISHVWSRMGAPEVATDASDVQTTDLLVALKPRTEWKHARTQSELMNRMQGIVGNFPGQTVWFTQPIEQRLNEMTSGVRADVAVKLFGDDFDQLTFKAQEIAAVMAKIPGCQDLLTEQLHGQPVLQIKVKQDAIARYGLPAKAVLDLVESISGKAIGEVVEGQFRYPLAARLPDSLRDSPESIAQIMLVSPAGERLALGQLADVRKLEQPKMIPREWSRRRITVQCNVRDRDIGSFIAEAQQRISGVKLPNGYDIEWGGQFENMKRAQRGLAIAVPAALCLILILLYATYQNVTDTLCIFLSVPYACAGGTLALGLRGLPFSISAAVGFITLSGVSVLNTMVFVSGLRLKLAEGVPIEEAIPDVAISRLRTVMMTSLVAAVGFAPMALSAGVGAEVQLPLATVVIGGVLCCTMKDLIVMPALYAVIGGGRRTAPKPSPAVEAELVPA